MLCCSRLPVTCLWIKSASQREATIQGTYVEPSEAPKAVRKAKKDGTTKKDGTDKKDGTSKSAPKKEGITGNVNGTDKKDGTSKSAPKKEGITKDKKGAAKEDAAKRDTVKKLEMDIGTSATETSDADFEEFLALQDKAHYTQQEDTNKLEGQQGDITGQEISNIDMNVLVMSILQQQARTAIL